MANEPKQFVIYKDARGEWRWSLYAANSKIIADSAEGYTSKQNCIHGISLVAGIATGANVWNRDTGKWE